MSRRALLASCILPILLDGSVGAVAVPIAAQAIDVRVTPVSIEPGQPMRTRVGGLTLLAGWELKSEARQFGGWSALHVSGSRVTAISDAGAVLRFTLGQFGRVRDARMVPLPAGCGPDRDKTDRDAESLARDPVSGDWLVGLEVRNAICRIDAGFARALRLASPHAMRAWKPTGGAEAMVRLPGGRVLVFAESGGRDHVLLVFDGDPTDPRTRMHQRRYRPPRGYAPVDAAAAPDGRLLVLNRRFSPIDRFTTVLVAIDPATVDGGAMIEGEVIARIAPPLLSDNYEGLAVTNEADATIVWLISDDNFMGWQATYLLKFRLDPEPRFRPRLRYSPLRSSASAAAP